MITDIREFCDTHHACSEGRDWALANCTDMADAWGKLQPEWLLWVATQPGVLDDRTLRLFACWSVRQVWHLLSAERSRNAVEVAERFANGEATAEELTAARAAAWAAARDAARAAAWDVAWDAARDAIWDAVWDAVWDVAWDAARDTIWGAVWDAVWNAQTQWLRDNVPNPFSGTAARSE